MRRLLLRALVGESRLEQLKQYQVQTRTHPRVAMAFARAAATSSLRTIDPTRPSTWEFSGFSQNGEDGIIDYLCSRLLRPNRYFIEIGAANGLENNTTWLALARRYGGLMIDGDPSKVAECRTTFQRLNWALEFAALMVNRETFRDVANLALVSNPDLFSLDIDSMDYHVARAALDSGFRPKIAIVEYNSCFGPDRAVTVPYSTGFNRHRAHRSGYYYGVSVSGLRRLFEGNGYQFVTVEQNGLNAFFADPAEFEPGFLEAIRGTEYRENIVHRRESRSGWAQQYEVIKHLPVDAIEEPVMATPSRERLAV
jgi:hypothetical protein